MDKAKKAEYQRRWYEKNRAEHKARTNARRIEVKNRVRAWLRELKESTPCADCGNLFPHYVLDFDHIGQDKEQVISRLVSGGYDIDRIQKEIDKCELVCANCHRVRTFTRGGDEMVIEKYELEIDGEIVQKDVIIHV